MKHNIRTNYQQKICQTCPGVLKYWAYRHSVIHAGRDLWRSPIPPPSQSSNSLWVRVGMLRAFSNPFWKLLRLDTRQPPWDTAPLLCVLTEESLYCIQLKSLLLSVVLIPCTLNDVPPSPWWAPGLSGHPYVVSSANVVGEQASSSSRTLSKWTDPPNICTNSPCWY